ncbi:hypothetical protein BO221_47870 [Archangium sp. Cb G35]|uniref:hypothetical protein n=1 Tax=Archangium sp. Cb G35 TaxID=1920190 RepID=UPI00093803DA|nr:hypothetical protein [Archangium sp. Cb G35]OJT16829.1 hypothetical protein BO221_47870 [Archangium sp. Cb G35]
MSQDPLEDSIEVVRQALGFAQPTAFSHRVTVITGLEAPAVIEALGHYLFEAGIAHSVRTNLAIARDLFEVNVAFANAFHEEAVRLLGADNNIDEKRRTTLRDPWIAEGIGHLLLLLSRKSPPLAPPGQLQVLTQIHADVHSHGLDLVGIHVEGEGLGLTIGEVKASDLNISAHVTETARLFDEVENGLREGDVRSQVQMLRDSLTPEHQKLITPAFWRVRRVFFPILGYAQASKFEPTNDRPTFAALACGADRIRLFSMPLVNHKEFFDQVADRIRFEASGLATRAA